MKWFLITLSISLAASDKLDRTYLPPPGAQFAGGVLGNHDAPLEPPHHTTPGQGPVAGAHEGPLNFNVVNGVNFGDKIPKVPTTTTSYAFSQTTTYPPGEGFETAALPINPVTGLPIQLDQGNYPYGPLHGQQNIQNLPGYTQTQAPIYGANIQPGVSQGPTLAPSQLPSQYPGSNMIIPGNAAQIPGSVYQQSIPIPGQLQYTDGQNYTKQQGLLPIGASDNQQLNQYPGHNAGGIVQNPSGNQGLSQYPGTQIVPEQQEPLPSAGSGQQRLVPTAGIPTNIQTNDYQYKYNTEYGSQGPQGTYTGQPINVQPGEPQPIKTSYQKQEPIHSERIPQYPNGNQDIPSSYYSGVSSTTPTPEIPSSTSAYSSVKPIYRPERPQAAADRNAVILNYENVRTPNGYSYSFDTSNGIHADESGIVDNGTKAQGSYSYTGDDGKVYTVIYTADENGFQPRGDHLPTSPPIPEAIQRVIEQAARDKAAGIVDDGSYDEDKYGDKMYQGTSTNRRPQTQNVSRFGNTKNTGDLDDLIKPIAGIKDEEYDEDISQKQFNSRLPITGTRKSMSGQARRPSNQVDRENSVQKQTGKTGTYSEIGAPPSKTYDENGIPIANERINAYGEKKLSNSGDHPSNKNNPTIDDRENILNNYRPSGRRPSIDMKDGTNIKYPGSHVNVNAGDHLIVEKDKIGNNEGQVINAGSPSLSDESSETVGTDFDSVTGAPIIGNNINFLRQQIKGNRKPVFTGNKYIQNSNNQPEGVTFTQKGTETPSISDYIKNSSQQPKSNQESSQQDEPGYYYQQPGTKFEQSTFPTRFNTQEVTSTMKPDQRKDYVEGTTRKPFITPNVYNQNKKKGQIAPDADGNVRKTDSTTRKPFTTVGVTSPSDKSYADYDNGDDINNKDIADDKTDYTKIPARKNSSSFVPYQSTQTTPKPQYPSGERTNVNEKETAIPGHRIDNAESGYTYGPTTPMLSHNSRFGNTEPSQRLKPHQSGLLTTIPTSQTAVGNPIPIQSSYDNIPSDNKYQTIVPISKYPSTNVVSGYPTGTYPGLGSMSTTPGISVPQEYYTSTYRPSQSYFSTTTVPPTSGYTQDSGSPSIRPVFSQPSQEDTFHTGYHYEPPKSHYSSQVPSRPSEFDSRLTTPSRNSGLLPVTPPGTYQTTYSQGPQVLGNFPTPGNQNTFIPSQTGTVTPDTSPIGTYQGNFLNGPSKPDYSTTIVSSTPGSTPVFGYPGSGNEGNNGYEYGPSRPTYTTTESPSTVGTTPGPYMPSVTNLAQGYPTTYGPDFQTPKDRFVSSPVDGFGRPITIDQGGLHPGFEHPTQGPIGNSGSFGHADQSPTYPGAYDQPRVIGEDFSGPKQPQRFDPKTGYHYK